MKIAVFAGDGIGPEVTAQALRVLHALGLPARHAGALDAEFLIRIEGVGLCDGEGTPHQIAA